MNPEIFFSQQAETLPCLLPVLQPVSQADHVPVRQEDDRVLAGGEGGEQEVQQRAGRGQCQLGTEGQQSVVVIDRGENQESHNQPIKLL